MTTKHYEPQQDSPRESPADVAARIAQGGAPEPIDVVRDDHEALRAAESEGHVDTSADATVDRQPPARAESDAPNPDAEEQQFTERVDSRNRRRDEIAERKSAERAAENARILAEQPEPVVEPVVEEPVEQQPPAAKHTLKVDRQTYEVDEDELIRLAQIGAAQGNRISEINNLAGLLRQRLAEAPASGQDAGRDSSPTRDESHAPAKAPTRANRMQFTDEQLGELHEKLLYGEKTEGVQAIRELFESVAGQGQDVPEPAELLNQLEDLAQQRVAMHNAGKAFAGKHPEIYADRTGASVIATVRKLHRDVVGELRAANLDAEQLRQAEADPDAAFWFHKDLRVNRGIPLTDPNLLTDEAANWVKEEQRKVFGGGDLPAVRAADPPGGRQQVQPQPGQREARQEQKEQMPLIRRAALSSAARQRQPAAGQPATKTPAGTVVEEYRERRLGPRSV